MLRRILNLLVDKLRRDSPNPIHSLDGWLLKAIENVPPSTRQELLELCAMRMGPRRKGPEIRPGHVRRWLDNAVDEELVQEEPPGPDGRTRWTVTEKGRKRRRSLQGIRAAVGNGIAFVARTPSVWAHAVERLALEDQIGFGKPPPKRDWLPPIKQSPGDQGITDEQAAENLRKVEHIVVLMMENRSFDHMLGYLDLRDGQGEINGLTRAKKIEYEGVLHEAQYLHGTAFPKSMDPPHGSEEIAKQIHAGAMDGFIESFATKNDVADAWRIMGYYTHRELPVYDYFAHNFLTCDHWFSSVPSATWPNRLYALTGTCDPSRESLISDGEVLFDFRSFVQLVENEHLDGTWRWYSWDPGTLRLVDDRYTANAEELFHHDHFRRVVQHAIEPPALTWTNGEAVLGLGKGLLEDAASGDLAKVSWIDPNFVDLSILEPNSNDDHPPSDVRAGQELVMMVYRALAESPRWGRTMLVVTYDEHGGFYDHEPPPRPPEENPQFDTYGVRVPAFVVSPLVAPGTVSHLTFDHTSITRAILERFGVEGAVEELARDAPRVAKAGHLGRLLTRGLDEDPTPPPYGHVNGALDAWRHRRAERRSAASGELPARTAADEPGPEVRGFPAEYLEAARRLRREPHNLPAGHP
jgi:phospholipase C